jgi:hypothetical protein
MSELADIVLQALDGEVLFLIHGQTVVRDVN